MPTCAVSTLVSEPGKRFYGHIRRWQDEQIETNLSVWWRPGEDEALLVISDLPACAKRISDYCSRWRVESTFQDLKSRGWDWEESHVRQLDRVDRLLFVLFVLLWWLAHLAAACPHHGHRARSDRHDRRDKSIFRLGLLYLLDVERHCSRLGDLKQQLLFRGSPGGWRFSLRF